ncbi:MAG: two-component system response regulator [Candidatus Eremiobacter antarcticus]|nr:response regulator [Candidatus Eremiobacteraeota bacterium]MBC5807840.1 response regulator [Candidatus Eremiobacteraeota bacterium]PZR62786.1 MAG: two-component system response regulator [Candidatus Eremiobacter sp. RRmetagenome_bin22]
MQILVVDDGQPALLIYKAMVRNLPGCVAVCFRSSSEALKWCELNEPAMAIVDNEMPPPDGLEFVRRFRRMEKHANTPILMISAEKDSELRHKALELGASDFLSKPVDVIECTARMRNVLQLARYRKQLEDQAGFLAGQVRERTQEIVARERETILRLAKLAEYRDTETGMHVARMAQYSRAIARGAGMPTADQEMILLAAPMHDIGKVAVPDSILLKPGPLEPHEHAIMEQHTVIGHKILHGSSSELLQTAAEIALTHHEKFNGSGYPNGFKAEGIPVFGRICALSDVFDALTSVRPYKPAWPLDRALREISRGAGTDFDPRLVEAFMSELNEIVRLRQEYSDEEAIEAGASPQERAG